MRRSAMQVRLHSDVLPSVGCQECVKLNSYGFWLFFVNLFTNMSPCYTRATQFYATQERSPDVAPFAIDMFVTLGR
jgi:hypothetical protein